MNLRFSALTAVLLTAVLIVSLTACGKDKVSAVEATAPPAALQASNPLEITPAGNLRARLKIGEPAWAEVGASITVAARVEVDETRVTRVGSPMMCRITSLHAREGQDVHKGETLALLTSTGLSDAQLAFLKSISQKQVQQRAVERAQLLLKADVIGSAELQRREAELVQASADLDAARDQLALLGMPAEAIDELQKTRSIHSVSRVVAGMDGTVLARKVTPGQIVQPADTVFEIADLSQVWLVADVPEQYAGNLAEGQVVEAEIAALPGQLLHGRLSFVSNTVNAETRTVSARMDLPNPRRRLKPAMLATMVLKEQTERHQVIPAAAVVRENDSEHVFIQMGTDTFVLRPVMLGSESAGRRVLLDGVRPGEKIVLDGAFHLNNERRRRALRGSDGG